MRAFALFSTLCALGLACPDLHAQRAEDNALTTAEDAFGSGVAGEDIGLYSATAVRGFSAIDAGNVRLEGLAIDRQAEFTSRLVSGNTVRVGLSAQRYPFPAPTGIVDYQLRRPAERRVVSLVAKADSFGASLVEADVLVPVDERFSMAGGLGLYRNAYFDGGQARVMSAALVPRWRPTERIEIVPFWSRIDIRDETASPVIVPSGAALPPRIERGRYFGQPWAGDDITRTNLGLLAGIAGEKWIARAGLFRSVAAPHRSFSSSLIDATPAGTARQIVVANPAQRFASDSGEVRLSRMRERGALQQAIHLSARARDQTRRYGGGHRLDLGSVRIGARVPVAPRAPTFGPQTRERVRQQTLGVAYDLRWRDHFDLGIGVQQTDYEKTRRTPDGTDPPSQDAPWLYNLSGAWHLTPRLTVYGSHTRGLEESAIAPETARNRDAAPPAILTRQSDFGVRWRVGPVRVNLARFSVEKPYYGVDAAQIFRELGDVRHQGVEFSLAGEAVRGLNLLAGAVALDARIRSAPTVLGEIGTRPVGTPTRTGFIGLDYRLRRNDAWSIDTRIERTGRVAANVASSLSVPARTVVDLGARYRFPATQVPVVLRLEATNLFDRYGWEVDRGGGLTYSAPRQLSAKITVDL